MLDAHAIQATLQSLGISLGEAEAQSLSAPLAAILSDLNKLDELETQLSDPDPLFRVEE